MYLRMQSIYSFHEIILLSMHKSQTILKKQANAYIVLLISTHLSMNSWILFFVAMPTC